MLTDDEVWDCYQHSHGNTEYTKAKAFGRMLQIRIEAKLRDQEPVGYLHPEKDKAISISDLNDQQLWTQAMWKIGKPLYLHPAPILEGWQPIVTAPKDGTRVLIKGDCTVVAGWQEITGMFGLMGWAIVNDSWMPSDEARYWMPLPKPLMAAARSGE